MFVSVVPKEYYKYKNIKSLNKTLQQFSYLYEMPG